MPGSGQDRMCQKPGCGHVILWAVTEARKWQPLNPDPDEAGNVAAWRDATGTWHARTLTGDQRPGGGEKRMMPHAATCRARPRRAPQPLPPNVIDWATAATAARARRAARSRTAATAGRRR